MRAGYAQVSLQGEGKANAGWLRTDLPCGMGERQLSLRGEGIENWKAAGFWARRFGLVDGKWRAYAS